MSQTNRTRDAGIDYGLGRTNIDHATGIRYGVISSHAISQAWYDSADADYGKPACPECGADVGESSDVPEAVQAEGWFSGKDYACLSCKECYWSDSVYSDEALGYSYNDDEYSAENCLQSDVILTRSPYYTFGPFCSPCVPGGVSLPDSADKVYDESNGVKAYCFGPDWFDDGKAPYKVYRVADDSEIVPEVGQ